MLDLVIADEPGRISNVKICAPLGSSKHNRLHNTVQWHLIVGEHAHGIKRTRIECGLDLKRGKYLEMNEHLKNINWSR